VQVFAVELTVRTVERALLPGRDSGDDSAVQYRSLLQESYSPLSHLTFNLGVRWEMQRMQDYQGNTALSINDNIAPRVGVVFDPSKEGRSKIFAHYGRYYESIPMNLAARGSPVWVPWRAVGPRSAATAIRRYWSSADLAVQKGLKGSYNDEVVVGGQYEVLQDLVIGTTLIYRWLGRAIEDMYDREHPNDGLPLSATRRAPRGPTRRCSSPRTSASRAVGFLPARTPYHGCVATTWAYTMRTTTSSIPTRARNTTRPGYGEPQWPLPNDRPHLIRLEATTPSHSALKSDRGLGFLSAVRASH